MIYFDAAATTPVRPEVLAALAPLYTTDFGNPSSTHSAGETAARALDYARRTAAEVLGCRPGDIVFTSGGTEADNLAVKGLALAAPQGRHIVSSAVEHPAVLESLAYLARHHGFRITLLPVDSDGRVDPAEAAAALTHETTLCTVMTANNEVGTVQPVAQIAQACRDRGIPFHTDAVQAAGWLPLSVDGTGIDAMSISGHKLGAPKGCGLLYVRGVLPLEPLLHGGGQERGRRSGTENVAGAVAVATALALADRERDAVAERARGLRDYLIGAVLDQVPGAVLTGHRTERLPGHASFCFPGTSGEAVLLEAERAGVLCSSGSACAAGSDEPSPVLTAMGVDRATAQSAVRLTFGPSVRENEITMAARALVTAVRRVRELQPNTPS
ncbi:MULTISPECIES: cysteine desulfurase family protein [Arthrobacter]|uniref:cysteine desulfurase family protein n=1 Tax=Arthrobacter TaxID=1663 RepID=UPI001D132A43|nr:MULTISPECIES: cysteine desulfurase family protein [Arthrobacter]MCC3280827.1 cysteine desulfurase [Arthrobacter caoxuetaonis]MCC9193009.1 cysteine desulfurase [Arthrobacter sp. zg-Y916]